MLSGCEYIPSLSYPPFNSTYNIKHQYNTTTTPSTTHINTTNMPGQHDNTPVQTIIYKPNEHADEYIVAIDDVAEVGPSSALSRALSKTKAFACC